MIRFLSGGNEYFVHRMEREFRSDFLAHSSGAQIYIFDFDLPGEEDKMWSGLQEAWQEGLFFEEKLIVIRDVLKNDIFSEKILNALKSQRGLLTDTSPVLLFSDTGMAKKGNDLLVWLGKYSERIPFVEKLSSQALERYALGLFAESGTRATLSLPALRALISECGNDMYRLENELSKLSFLKSEGDISENDIRDLIPFAPGGTVFEALDLIVADRRDGAIQLFARELGKGEDVFRILGSCAWQLRVLLSVRDAYDRGIRQSQAIADRTGLKEYSVRKCLSAIAKLPMDRLKKSFEFLAEADARIKTGALRPDLAVYLFVAKF